MVVDGHVIDRADIPKYFTEGFWASYDLWQNCKRFGLPFGGGWAEQPAWILRLIKAFDGAIDGNG
jgi:hypothetical protein